VDVQDIAAIHVAAILDPEVKHKRLQCWGHHANWNDFLAVLRELRPQREFVNDYPEYFQLSASADQSDFLAILKKWTGQNGYKSLRNSIKETIDSPYFHL